MKTYDEVIVKMVKDEAIGIAINGGPSMIYVGTHMVEFIYGVSQNQIYKDIKSGLTSEVLKNAQKEYKEVKRKLKAAVV
jgi:hypothetical protein